MSDSIAKEIKKMEQERRQNSGGTPLEKKVHFESWFNQRKHLIPEIHKKEVILADFKARGLDIEATMEQFDRALRLYGVKF